MRSRAGYRFALVCTFWIAALTALSGVAQSEVPFTFTVPQSRVIVKISEPSLLPDAVASAKPNYFKLTRREPLLIVSGWLEPAQQYEGAQRVLAGRVAVSSLRRRSRTNADR